MELDELIEQSIRNQFAVNRKKNLLFKDLAASDHFLPETKELLFCHRNELSGIANSEKANQWVDLMTGLAFNTFCNSNQYLDLRQKDFDSLRVVYELLWKDIAAALQNEEMEVDLLQRAHLNRLTEWIVNSNAFVKALNSPDISEIVEVACAEYSALLQLRLLQIDLTTIKEPVLDIGCGEHAKLVTWLRALNIDTRGIDRLADEVHTYLSRVNWFEYDFHPEAWGTIIANNSFSLHFSHHNERQDGDFAAYAKKYMDILASLSPGGTFYYAPSLPFIEQYLPAEKYRVTNGEAGNSFFWTKVQKLND